MSESAHAVQPSDDDKSFFRRRTTDGMADIHQEAQRLIAQAQAVQNQWLAAHARMMRV